MNILYVVHRLPYPPNKGDKIRSFHQIRYLSTKHTVYLACLIDEKEDFQHIETLGQYCAGIDTAYKNKNLARLMTVPGLLSNKPLSVAFFSSKELQKKITRRVRNEKLDRILVFSSAMAEYVRDITGIPKIMDFVDLDSEKWRVYADYQSATVSWIYRLEAGRLARYEEELARAFDRSIFVSKKEADLYQRQVNGRSVSVNPNGVDLDYFAPRDSGRCSDPPTIVFAGTMDYFPNIDAVKYFCKEIFPVIRKTSPDAQFHIVGRNPTRRVRELGDQPNVIVTGSVSDIRPYLEKARVAVAPFRIARGIQNKILEAMAMGIPVVGTSLAFQGIQATLADGIRRANDPRGFAQEVIAFLEDSELRRECSLQARRYVQHNHRWEDHGIRLEALLREVE